jgi:hypothetical protein
MRIERFMYAGDLQQPDGTVESDVQGFPPIRGIS